MPEPEPLFGADESTLVDFGETGREFFSEAWEQRDDHPDIEAFTAQSDVGQGQEADLVRSLSRRPLRRWFVAIALLAIVASLLSVFLRDGRFDEQPVAEPTIDFDAVLSSPGEPRTYDSDGVASPDGIATVLVDRFGRFEPNGEMSTIPSDDTSVDLPIGVSASPLIWGSRLHVAVMGPPGFADDRCVVVTLVASDLETLDVAAAGQGCADRFAPTGDRTACMAGDTVLLEVWPPSAIDPAIASGVPTLPVAEIRVRVEQIDRAGWAESSVRGDLDLRDVSLTRIETLAALPGATVDFAAAGSTGSCVLLDRANVDIKTL